MKHWTTALTTANELSLVAIDEASRRGMRSADLEHLLLALTVTEQPAGDLLRRQGATLVEMRRAVDEYHAEHLAAVGISNAPFPRGRIRDDAVEITELTDRVRALFHQVAIEERSGDAAAVLSQLMSEPSGTVHDLLQRAGVDTGTLTHGLADLRRQSPKHTVTIKPGELTAEKELFVPAEVAAVWSLVSSAQRLPEWEPTVDKLRPMDDDPTSGLSANRTKLWSATPRTRRRRDGRPTSPRRGWEQLMLEQVKSQALERIIWRFTYPHAHLAAQRTLDISMQPSPGGTAVHLVTRWHRSPRRGMTGMRLLASPFTRFAAHSHLHQVSAGISRALRR